MDADSVSHLMNCRHLLSDDDYKVIMTAPNDMKINCILLQYVKLLSLNKLLQFCSVLKEIDTQENIGQSLEACKCANPNLLKTNYFVKYILCAPKVSRNICMDIQFNVCNCLWENQSYHPFI